MNTLKRLARPKGRHYGSIWYVNNTAVFRVQLILGRGGEGEGGALSVAGCKQALFVIS